MVASQKTQDALKTIGLNKYERNIWTALLSQGSSTAGELSDISKVPRSRCYDILESLSDRGFVVVQPGKPMKYIAISPSESLSRAKKKIREHATEMEEKMERMMKSEAIKELERLHKGNIKTVQPHEMTGALKGRQAFTQQIETMMKNAKKSVKLVTTENGLVELAENNINHMKRAADAGIKIQIAAKIGKNREAAAALSKYAQIRSMEKSEKVINLLGRFVVVDGQELVLGLTDDTKTHPTQDVAFWTQSSHAASNVFEPVFDTVWNHSKPLR